MDMRREKVEKSWGGRFGIILVISCLLVWLTPVVAWAAGDAPDYAAKENWAYYNMTGQERIGECPSETEAKPADCFLICPSVFLGDAEHRNMPLDDEAVKANFVGALNMEVGIYQQTCRMYSPYYRMMSLSCYEQDQLAEQSGDILGSTQHAGVVQENAALAYADVAAAFEYYLANENKGRPIVLAGFSQGAEMVLRLLEQYGNDSRLRNHLAAAYVIGWRITPADLARYPYLKMAESETDTGVIVSFNAEAASIDGSLVVSKGCYTYGINPLNWKTDSTMADKSLNKGACFTQYDGSIRKEVPQYTGAYRSAARGTLIVTDVDMAGYPSVLKLFPAGVYHLYDYQFFFRNLAANVAARTKAYLAAARQTGC